MVINVIKKKKNNEPSSQIIELDKRSKKIFSLIVEDYMNTGGPVGSRKLSNKLEDKLSPASVRNVMCDLQEAGLLTSTHSSAGRFPTDLGMQFFVDGLLQVGRLSQVECSDIKKKITSKTRSAEEIYDDATHLLSGLSDCAGIVVAPKLDGGMKHIEFVPISKEQALVVMVSDKGLVENRLIKLPKGLPSNTLVEISNYLNSRLKGRSLLESQYIIKEEIKNDRKDLDEVSKKLIDQGLACWADANKKNKLIITGTSKLLEDVKAIEELENIRLLIERLEDKQNLIGIIQETQEADGLQIFIGSDNSLFAMTGCSTIISPFKNKDKEIIGAIGVVGPMRINYAKIIPVVDYTAKLLGQKITF
ncbi:MAG: heat-inducible transcriptional repressor HrcA [Rickettsiales bacterium]|nr:heat-inducible transcriptional repressor HrcA [Rickettsiales bacterium]OUV54770.1 MAG: heat-inducible transcriptional repressor HrcA [Rickettsiales bacterium TMED127]|tara:strand:+ start:15720 stop:16805 length:1086 start_codon:yes stop_codon:yes gene_type:complete